MHREQKHVYVHRLAIVCMPFPKNISFQLICYTQVYRTILFSGTWSSPSFSGTRPPPCGVFSLTSIDDHRALLYGGYDGERRRRVSDLYLIDFQTMVCCAFS